MEEAVVPSYDIFLSYSAKDRVFVTRLEQDLSKAGFRVWVDIKSMNIGASIAGAIQEALATSRFLLVVMSPNYFASSWTAKEWQYSLGKEVETGTLRVIPILYRDCDIPPILLSKRWVDFRDESLYNRAFGDLVRGIHALSSGGNPERGNTETAKPGERIEQLDTNAVTELKKVLQDAVEAFRAKPDTPSAITNPVNLGDIDEDVCFIVMPFGVESLGIVYEDFVKPTLADRCQLRPERGDDLFGSDVVMDDITKSIRRARLIIADLTGKNPNVFYEVGIAHALNKQVLLMTQSIDDVPFDLRHRRALVYEYSPRGCKKLEKDLFDNVQNMLQNRHKA